MITSGNRKIKVGTRGSKLALIQKDNICGLLKEKYEKIEIETVIIKTIGDNIKDIPIAEIGTPGVFSEDLARALLQKQLNFVVHSMKDLPTKINPGTVIAMISNRESSEDVVILPEKYKSLSEIPAGGVIGTSSPRRISQLLRKYPNLTAKNIRGNIGTRINKLIKDNQYDAIILALAALKRLKIDHVKFKSLGDDFLYAVGQGALAVQCEESETELMDILAQFTHVETAFRCICEREILKTLGGGCCVPLGVKTEIENSKIKVECAIFSLDGKSEIRKTAERKLPEYSEENSLPFVIVSDVAISEKSSDAAKTCANVGFDLAQELITCGGRDLMRNIRHVCQDKPIDRIISLNNQYNS